MCVYSNQELAFSLFKKGKFCVPLLCMPLSVKFVYAGYTFPALLEPEQELLICCSAQ